MKTQNVIYVLCALALVLAAILYFKGEKAAGICFAVPALLLVGVTAHAARKDGQKKKFYQEPLNDQNIGRC